jgi:hypothetical protein
VTLSWDPLPGVRQYELQRSMDGVHFELLARTPDASAVHSPVEPASTAIYRVRAADGSASAPLLVRTRSFAAAELTALGRQPRQIVLQWRDSPGRQTYRIERSVDGRPFEAIATTPPNACGYRDSAVEPTLKYRYRLVTMDEWGEVGATPVVAAVPAVGDVAAQAFADGAVGLRWRSESPTARLLIERKATDEVG